MIIIEKNDLIELVKLFRNKACYHHSHYEAGQIWRDLERFIEQPYLRQIGIEWRHVQLQYNSKQACESLNNEIENYIEYLNKPKEER